MLWIHKPIILCYSQVMFEAECWKFMLKGEFMFMLDQRHLNEAYIQYRAELMRYLSRILRHQQDVEDLVQDCFIRLMNVKSELEESRIPYYLKVIARNLAIDAFRKKVRTAKRDSRLNSPRFYQDTLELEIEEGVHEMVSLIGNQQHRRIVELRIIHGYTIKETAQLMNCSESMIKSSVHSAVKRMRSKHKVIS